VIGIGQEVIVAGRFHLKTSQILCSVNKENYGMSIFIRWLLLD